MCRIVYAADNFTPSPGIIVLPLEAHPAIIEDARWRNTNTSGKRGYNRKSPLPLAQVAQRVVEYLRVHGRGMVSEIATGTGLSKGGIYRSLTMNPDLFEVVGENRSHSNRWRSVAVWGLVD